MARQGKEGRGLWRREYGKELKGGKVLGSVWIHDAPKVSNLVKIRYGM